MTPPRGASRSVCNASTAGASAVVLALALAACGADATPPRLVDGSRAPKPPDALRSLGHRAALTRVRTIAARALDANGRACIRSELDHLLPPDQVVVERTGVAGSSLTFRSPRGRFVYGCVRSSGSVENGEHWCGHVVGELGRGRLRDPRVDIGCTNADGERVGSAWVDPVRGARWIVVRGHDLSEVYEVAGALPVRVTTASVDVPTSSALFRIEQYDTKGARVSESTLRAFVAG